MHRWIQVSAFALVLGGLAAAPADAVEVEFGNPGGPELRVALHEITARDGVVSGVVENRGDHLVRDVRLLIQRAYQWPNEFRPGEDNPSRAEVYAVAEPIAPGERVTFRYEPSEPLPELDGEFETRVEVLSFREVLPPAVSTPSADETHELTPEVPEAPMLEEPHAVMPPVERDPLADERTHPR